jgi:hypothetical protein
MKELYPIIAFGVILFYSAIALFVFVYALVIRLPPLPARLPVVSGALEKIRALLR